MFGIGAFELIIILVIALIFIGPKKLPELARGLGKGIREFQKAKDDLMGQVNFEDNVAETSTESPAKPLEENPADMLSEVKKDNNTDEAEQNLDPVTEVKELKEEKKES